MTTTTLSSHRLYHARGLALGSLGAVLGLVALWALGVGAVPISAGESLSILWHRMVGGVGHYSDRQAMIFWSIRLPRLVETLLVGAALGVSGCALQGLFRNPLVEPALIGVSSGAALFTVVAMVFSQALAGTLAVLFGNYLLPAFAFVGGLVTTWIAYRLSQARFRTDVTLLILAGVAMNALTGALVGLVIFYADDAALRDFTFWSLGDLGGAHWQSLLVHTPLLIGATLGLLFFHRPLNALSLGESEAFHMGVEVEKVKKQVVVLSALAVGSAVSLCGIIGFVGLVVPHMVRLVWGSDHRLVLPASCLGGALLLLLADLLARTLVRPAELPIGVITALLGAPFFMFLLVRQKQIHHTR
ncbi:iron complex transport system permease protein [Catalinimonas alkaloidigena]|uniref:Iron complex transport system permease protein n=1 Tax=Catalinimonas alkaloidigena TaxID=1075417 RepID=A0A1G9KDD6_9BACT|nr:iron ABC transporter permease [Catalinimonas alkaloidigena]SDL47707.1 iron complex transport system permease protein [Catalinimonas alkaloidigena]